MLHQVIAGVRVIKKRDESFISFLLFLQTCKNCKNKSNNMKKYIKYCKNGNIFLMKKISLVVFLLACFLLVSGLVLVFHVVFPMKYKSEILSYSNEYDLEPNMVAAIICVESRFDREAQSGSGACGLMQLMPATFSWAASQINMHVENPDIFSVDENISAGCFYLRYLFDKFQNEVFVLAAYNAGEGVVSKWGAASNFSIDQIQYLETKNYVIKVQKLAKFYLYRI